MPAVRSLRPPRSARSSPDRGAELPSHAVSPRPSGSMAVRLALHAEPRTTDTRTPTGRSESLTTSNESTGPIIPDFEKDAQSIAAYDEARVRFERREAGDA